MDFLLNEAGENFSSADGKFWKTVGMLNPITGPGLIASDVIKKVKNKQQQIPETPPTGTDTTKGAGSGGTDTTTQTQQGGMSTGAKVGIAVGVVAIVGLVIFLVVRKK
jgi:hypothetical protein